MAVIIKAKLFRKSLLEAVLHVNSVYTSDVFFNQEFTNNFTNNTVSWVFENDVRIITVKSYPK